MLMMVWSALAQLKPVDLFHRAKKITDARAHPDAIVETGSLSSVEPPDPTYAHHLQV